MERWRLEKLNNLFFIAFKYPKLEKLSGRAFLCYLGGSVLCFVLLPVSDSFNNVFEFIMLYILVYTGDSLTSVECYKWFING